MGGHSHHVEYHYRTSPSQLAELERQRKLEEENKLKLKNMEEAQRKQKEEEEKIAKQKEEEEIKRKQEELENQKKKEEEEMRIKQNNAYNEFIDKCNVISIEKINSLVELFSKDFSSKYLPNKLFQSSMNYIKSIFDLSSRTFKLKENLDKILDNFLQNEVSKINTIDTKLNILVIGPSGVGKSTLINEFLELDEPNKAKTSDSDSCTMNNELYESPKNPQFALIDTRGIEKNLESFGIEKMIENIEDEICVRNKSNDPKKYIHGIWYCINSSRLEDSEINCLNKLANIYRNSGMPILIVFTQSINKYMAEEIEKKVNSLNKDFEFVRVLAKEKYIDDGILIPSKGLDNLKEITLKKCSKSYLPAYCKTIEENMKCNILKFITNIKNIKNSKKINSINKNELISLIKDEIKIMFKECDSSISQYPFNIEIENEINLFFEEISKIFKQEYQCYEEDNKKDLFNKLKELNAEMRNSNNNLIQGITKEISDSFYNNNSNKLNEIKENFEIEFIFNYFLKEFSTIFYENIEKTFIKQFDSIYINKIGLKIVNMF